MGEPSKSDKGKISFVPAGYDSEDSEDEYNIMPSTSRTPSYGTSTGSGPGSALFPECLEDERIKIVPHIGWHAGLHDRDFDIDLDDSIANWFEGFRENFKTFKRGPIISKQLQMFYMNTQNPFQWALKLFANCPDHNSAKGNSLAYIVIEELATFKQHNNPPTDQLLDDNLRMVAFNFVAKHGHSVLFRLVVDTFELLKRAQMFVPKIWGMLERKQYKEAGQVATDLQLFDEFDEHAFVIPLFLQDKISIAEDFLKKATRLQEPVIRLLDSFFDKRESVEAHCSRYITTHNVTDVYYSKLHHKPLSKLVQRLAKNFNVPKESTPNVHRMKSFGALQFLVYKRYNEKSLNKDSWDEMVRDTVSNRDTELQHELVYMCSNSNDQAEAARWAKHFRIETRNLPLLVQDYLAQQKTRATHPCQTLPDEVWDADELTISKHILSVDESHIHLVDSRDKFYAMITDLAHQSIIAFDSEWKPTFGGSNEFALIQLATRKDIYLIDVQAAWLESSDWASLAKSVFNKEDVLKLAFAPSTDIAMFQKALPAFYGAYSSQTRSTILDLQDLWRYVETVRNFRFPYHEETTNRNLSNLVKLCFGKQLDKSNQFSNWAQRPLRKEQLLYAALDAYCLLEIYDLIDSRLQTLLVDLGEVVDALLNLENRGGNRAARFVEKSGRTNDSPSADGGGRSRNRRHRSKRERDMNNDPGNSGGGEQKPNQQGKNKSSGSFEYRPGPNLKSVYVQDVRFVCDKMLEGLARILRRFGMDTLAIQLGENANRGVFVALEEKRFLLTRGNNFYKFSEYLPPGHCYKVSNDRVEEQLLEVLRYYKVIVRQENIFSRCQLCNCGRFLTARPEDIYCLKYGTLEIPDSFRQTYRKEQVVEPERIKLDRSWVVDQLEERHRLSGLTDAGARIEHSYVSDSVLLQVDVFYICDGCGRCYWDGSHLDNMLAGRLAELLTLEYDD
ncbi:exonuclease mut-7 homolog [Uranotaenia lowii]|uniref:exonuclease mut-7 homolog n=1 Tax=Uranotaenia lowii TaxID=190385 RepID=UPI00247B26CE|nr:exonuclease mut-7 homolog [Uranotaenia lowii]